MEPENTIIRARDVMSERISSIDGMATAKEAAEKMKSDHVTSLLVNKRHPDDAWGIIVIQDLIRGVIIPGRSSSDVNVYEIMTKPIITIPADMDIRYAARLLFRSDIRRGPVEDHGELIGMLTLSALILNNDLF